MCRGHEQRAQFIAAPSEIGCDLRDMQSSDQFARRSINPDAARTRDPDIAALVAFHPIGAAALRRRLDLACKQALARQGAVGRDVERADQLFRAVVDVEQLLIRRKAKAVRLLEQIAIDREMETAVWRQPIDGLEAELARTLDAETRHTPINRVGEIDRAVG